MHSLSLCYGLLTALVLLNVLPDCEMQHNFFHKWCNCAMHERRNDVFQGGSTSGFFEKFFWGCPKVVKVIFLPFETKKTAIFLTISNSCHHSDSHACV